MIDKEEVREAQEETKERVRKASYEHHKVVSKIPECPTKYLKPLY